MNQKSFEFRGTAGGYFVVFLVVMIMMNLSIFGWPVALNYTAKWIADNLTVDGRQVRYSARYGETFKFLFLNFLLILITLGIYLFWFMPKMYRFVADHLSFEDAQSQPQMATEPQLPPQPQTPVQPMQEPTVPSSPQEESPQVPQDPQQPGALVR